MPANNPVKMIIDSGSARASKDQLKQLSAIKGLVVDPLGKIVELPTKSNYREGFSIFEYVTSTRGSRKGLTDSALKTADAGYLTRRLVDVSHDMIIRMDDCGTSEGWEVARREDRQASFAIRTLGRIFAAADIVAPESKKVLIAKGEEITEENAKLLDEHNVESVLAAERNFLSGAVRYVCKMLWPRFFNRCAGGNGYARWRYCGPVHR